MEKRHLDLSSSPLRGRAKVLKGAVAGAAAASVVSPGRKKDDDDEVYDSSEDDDEYDEKEFAEGPARNPNDVGVFVKGMNRVFCAYCQGLLEVWFVEVDAVDKHNAFTHPMYLNLGKESPGNTLMKRLGFRFLLRRRASTSDGDSYAKKTVVEGTGKPRVFPVHVAVRVCKKEEGSTAESRKRIGLKLVEVRLVGGVCCMLYVYYSAIAVAEFFLWFSFPSSFRSSTQSQMEVSPSAIQWMISTERC